MIFWMNRRAFYIQKRHDKVDDRSMIGEGLLGTRKKLTVDRSAKKSVFKKRPMTVTVVSNNKIDV